MFRSCVSLKLERQEACGSTCRAAGQLESCCVCGSDWLRNSRLSEMLDQEIGQNPYFP
jgi:hypothetical protein